MCHHIKPILQVIILTTTMLVSSLHDTVLENTTKCPITLCLVISKYQIQLNDKAISSTPTQWKFQFYEINFKSSSIFVAFLYTAPYKTETKLRAKIGAESVVQTNIMPVKTKCSNQLIKPLHIAPTAHYTPDAQRWVRASNAFYFEWLVAKEFNWICCQNSLAYYRCRGCKLTWRKSLKTRRGRWGSHIDMVYVYVPAFWGTFSQNLV